MMRNILIGLGLLFIFLLGWRVSAYYYLASNPQPEEQSRILLEQINKVAKLITVEGHFIEYYDYNEPTAPLFIGPIINYKALLPQKAAKIRIRAKVLVGYDMEKIHFEAQHEERKIILRNLPEPEIIAIDHQFDHFDNEASIFRPLNSADYVKIDQGAQEQIKKAAMESRLIESASQQGNDLIELMEFMVKNAGWHLEIENRPPKSIQ